MRSNRKFWGQVATVVGAFVIVTFTVGGHCGENNTVTGPQSTPTPTPAVSIAGAWQGTITYDSLFATDCPTLTASASATFSQSGSAITGTLTTNGGGGCGGSIAFQGTLSGNNLSGTTTTFGTYIGTASGTASNSMIHLVATNPSNGASVRPGGTFDLTR